MTHLPSTNFQTTFCIVLFIWSFILKDGSQTLHTPLHTWLIFVPIYSLAPKKSENSYGGDMKNSVFRINRCQKSASFSTLIEFHQIPPRGFEPLDHESGYQKFLQCTLILLKISFVRPWNSLGRDTRVPGSWFWSYKFVMEMHWGYICWFGQLLPLSCKPLRVYMLLFQKNLTVSPDL